VNIPQPLITAYNELAPFLLEVEKRLAAALQPYAHENLLPTLTRVKTIESAAEKIETGRYRAFKELDDLVACTLVVPNLQHESQATAYCNRVFKIVEVRGRASVKKPPELFRFDSTRLYGFLIRPEGSGDRIGATIFDIKFEVQIRTAFEHAWIVSTHPLTYKSDQIDWKRFRLAAQLKASAEQLDLSIVQFEQLSSAVTESPWPEIQQKVAIVQLLEKLRDESVIPAEAFPKDMSRFADNLLSLLRASKKKVEFEDAVNEVEAVLRSFTQETFPRSASLLQVCMGGLCQRNVLSGPLQRYSCHVTEQLQQLFPEVKTLTPIFEY